MNSKAAIKMILMTDVYNKEKVILIWIRYVCWIYVSSYCKYIDFIVSDVQYAWNMHLNYSTIY